MKGTSTIKCINTSVVYSQNGSMDFAKALACSTVLTKKWQKCLHKVGITGATLTDLSKSFDCILHNTLIAKLAAYSFGYQYQSIKESWSFLSNRQQRMKIGNAFRCSMEILYGVLKGSLLGPLHFNIFFQGFPNSGKEWRWNRKFCWEDLLLGSGT